MDRLKRVGGEDTEKWSEAVIYTLWAFPDDWQRSAIRVSQMEICACLYCLLSILVSWLLTSLKASCSLPVKNKT